jgi:hypothetical protein
MNSEVYSRLASAQFPLLSGQFPVFAIRDEKENEGEKVADRFSPSFLDAFPPSDEQNSASLGDFSSNTEQDLSSTSTPRRSTRASIRPVLFTTAAPTTPKKRPKRPLRAAVSASSNCWAPLSCGQEEQKFTSCGEPGSGRGVPLDGDLVCVVGELWP